ncbi:MAG TPA: DUF5715 family protein [Thermoanaerobaculia bacterium]|nr:DUF5715 family protein [Thermoanaerobaculia bacterium]
MTSPRGIPARKGRTAVAGGARARRRVAAAVVLLSLGAASSALAAAASLRGSRGAMARQARVARSHEYTYLADPQQVRRFADQGWLSLVTGGRDYELAGVSFPYARPEVVLFIERLSRQYRSACGERLVVTSLTRPKSHQPRNASARSVHPTGMALDLRRSTRGKCRRWLEATLLTLERRGVLDATYESRPPHYHVALFPRQYEAYVKARNAGAGARDRTHVVRRGDTLWGIAHRYGTSVGSLRASNGLGSDRLQPGQVLAVR